MATLFTIQQGGLVHKSVLLALGRVARVTGHATVVFLSIPMVVATEHRVCL